MAQKGVVPEQIAPVPQLQVPVVVLQVSPEVAQALLSLQPVTGVGVVELHEAARTRKRVKMAVLMVRSPYIEIITQGRF